MCYLDATLSQLRFLCCRSFRCFCPLHILPHFLFRPSVSPSGRCLSWAPSCVFSIHRQHLGAEAECWPSTCDTRAQPQEGPGLLQTDDQRDVAMLVSTDKELAFSALRGLLGYGNCLVHQQILRLQDPVNSNSTIYLITKYVQWAHRWQVGQKVNSGC